jgi:23S rRNA (cytosine1962-C5)-methyltransferase
MSYPVIKLVPGKEAAIGFWHPWVFSGAIASIPDEANHGDLVHVADREGKIIGTGMFSNKSSIAVRVFEFKEVVIDRAWFVSKLRAAADRRLLSSSPPFHGGVGGGYRLCFGESDNIPGLVVDKYADTIVFQISTMGLDRMREDIVAALDETFTPATIVERSDIAVRREEGLNDFVAIHKGEVSAPIPFVENGLNFIADMQSGQKTGFFLDQRDLRKWILEHHIPGRVLNLFSYSGSAGIAAMKAGAERVHNVDGSVDALELCKKQAELNGIAAEKFTTEISDVFDWMNLNKESRYDAVIMDPPALIKAGRDAEEGKKAYHFLNRAAMRLVNDGGLFITSSCSHFLPEEDLAFILRRASVQAGIRLDVLAVVRQSADHPLSVYFPESAYLKTFICRVSR